MSTARESLPGLDGKSAPLKGKRGGVSVRSGDSVAIMVISLKFARFKGNDRPGLRPRAAPCFMDNHHHLRDFMDSRGDRLLLCIHLPFRYRSVFSIETIKCVPSANISKIRAGTPIMVISLKFARFKGNHRPGLRPRAAPCFMDNQRDLRVFMDSRGDRTCIHHARYR